MSLLKTRKGRILYTILLAIIILIVGLFALVSGPIPITIKDFISILKMDNSSKHFMIIQDVRLPRMILGMFVGACLATAGAILQAVMKNPLADPGIIGVSSGAGLAAVIAMVLLPQYSYLLPIAAFLGALTTSLAIYFLAWDEETSPVKIILAGVAINALLGAIMNGIMVVYSDRVQAVLPWLSGGLTGRGWYEVKFMFPYAIIGLFISFFAIKPVNILLFGDTQAKLLGQRVELIRFLLITLSSLLAGIAVSVAGLVGFVGLVVPHFIRLLLGEDYRYLLPFSMVTGAILVVFADTIARTAFDPIELPVGILLACIGAPFFLMLLKKRRVY